MPLLGCQVILAFASLTILQSIGWTGLEETRALPLHKFTQKRTFRSPTEVLFFCTSLHLSLQITDRNERYFFRFFYHVFFIYKSPVRSASTQPIGIAIQIPTSPIAVAESI